MKSLKLSHKIIVSLQLFPGKIKSHNFLHLHTKQYFGKYYIFTEQSAGFQGQLIVYIVAVCHVRKGIVVEFKYQTGGR